MHVNFFILYNSHYLYNKEKVPAALRWGPLYLCDKPTYMFGTPVNVVKHYTKPVRGRIVDDLWIVCRPGAEVRRGVTDRIGMAEGTASDGSDAPAITIAQKL